MIIKQYIYWISIKITLDWSLFRWNHNFVCLWVLWRVCVSWGWILPVHFVSFSVVNWQWSACRRFGWPFRQRALLSTPSSNFRFPSSALSLAKHLIFIYSFYVVERLSEVNFYIRINQTHAVEIIFRLYIQYVHMKLLVQKLYRNCVPLSQNCIVS